MKLRFIDFEDELHDETGRTVDRISDMMINWLRDDLSCQNPYDHINVILEIHPGSGGTEAQTGDMSLRM